MSSGRSRAFWDAPLGPRQKRPVPDVGGSSPPTHTHRLPRIVIGCLVGFAVVQVLTLAALGMLAVFVYQDHQYVQGRGVYRDAEAIRQDQRLREGLCDLLDTFPADSPLLDGARAKYGCGPGIPRDQLPPEVRQQLGERNPAPPAVAERDELPRADRSAERPDPAGGAGSPGREVTTAQPPTDP